MHIQRIQEHLLRWVATLFIIVAALFLVKKAADGSTGMVTGAFVGVLIATLLFVMRERIWVLIPIAWPLGGNIPALGLPLMTRDILLGVIFGIFITLKAFKKITRKAPWNFTATISTVLILYVVVCWLRNPTGFAALDSARVGGRPYLNIVIATITCWMLRQCSLSPKHPTLFVGAIAFARSIEGLLGQFIYWFPGTYYLFSQYYDSAAFMWAKSPEELNLPPGEEGSRRFGYLAWVGQPFALLAVSIFRPLSMVTLRFWYPLLYGFALLCAFLAGFRSIVTWIAMATVLSSFLRRGWSDVLKIGASITCVLAVLIIGNGSLFELPYPVQRALCFLPGRWDPIAIADTAGSTEWRVQMWKELLTTNRYIENHVLGDGFGMRKRDLETIEFNNRWGNDKDLQENYMINGGVHSGPVSTIRSLGYVGLAIELTFLVAIAVHGYRLARRAKNTPFQSLAYFLAIPVIMEPLYFTVIFGAAETAIPDGLMAIGMLQMLENSLEDYEKTLAETTSEELISSSSSHRLYENASRRADLPVPPADRA